MVDVKYFGRAAFKDDGQDVHRIAQEFLAAKGAAGVEHLWQRAREAIGRGDGVTPTAGAMPQRKQSDSSG